MDDNKKHETIVFSLDNYENKDELFNTIAKQLQLLLDAGYLAVVRYDEPGLGIIVIEFEHNEYLEFWGVNKPMWVTPEEEDEIVLRRENNCNCEVKLDND